MDYEQKWQVITVRLPNDLKQLVEREAQKRGESNSTVIRDAIRRALGLDAEEARA